MQRIKNIENIVQETIEKTSGEITTSTKHKEKFPGANDEFKKSGETYKNDFLDCIKKDKTQKKWYDNPYKKYKERQKIFFEKLQIEGGIYFCPYCGKNTITHFKNDDGVFKRLYDIEHFLPRSLYSALSINLYNWLPACMSCNQRLKKDIDPLMRSNKKENELNTYERTDYIQIFHPYFGFIQKNRKKIKIENKTFDDKMSFVQNVSKERAFVLSSEHGKKFQLDKIYLHSEDTFQIFQFIYDKYSKIKDEYSRFKDTGKNIESFIDYFLNRYYPKKEGDILKYGNGKYKKDLIEFMKKCLKGKN